MKNSRVKLPLNSWGPWKDNPSKTDNFYNVNEEFKEEVIEETTQEVINVDEVIEKIEESSLNIQESADPYADILRDLKK